MTQETYLGDGVYASFDGQHIWLYTRTLEWNHRIAIELAVYTALVQYADKVWPKEADSK